MYDTFPLEPAHTNNANINERFLQYSMLKKKKKKIPTLFHALYVMRFKIFFINMKYLP